MAGFSSVEPWGSIREFFCCCYERRSEFIMPADRAWGSLAHNGSWNGMMGMIVRGEAEIAVAEFTMTALRAEAVDFTVPLINTRFTAVSLSPYMGDRSVARPLPTKDSGETVIFFDSGGC